MSLSGLEGDKRLRDKEVIPLQWCGLDKDECCYHYNGEGGKGRGSDKSEAKAKPNYFWGSIIFLLQCGKAYEILISR